MPRHRSHSIDFKRQVVAEYHAGETLHALGRRHDQSRNLIRIWVEKAESGSLDQDMASAELQLHARACCRRRHQPQHQDCPGLPRPR